MTKIEMYDGAIVLLTCRGEVCVLLSVLKRIPVTLHVETKNWCDDQSSEGAECV